MMSQKTNNVSIYIDNIPKRLKKGKKKRKKKLGGWEKGSGIRDPALQRVGGKKR